MRAAALLFLPALAALACVAFLEIATGGPEPVKAGETQSFVWKKRVFKNKQQFEIWLERRNVSYADWTARHPKVSPPWKDESKDDGIGALPLLAAGLAGIAAFFVLTRDTVTRSARHAFPIFLARLRPEESVRPFAENSAAVALRDAVSAYGLPPPRGAEPPRELERPELVLVESPRVEPRVEPKPDPVVVEPPPGPAVAADPEPEVAAEASPPRRPRPKRRPEKAPVEAPQGPAVAADPEPEVAAEAPPPRRPRPKRRPEKTPVETPQPVAAAPAEKPARHEPEPEPEPAPKPEPEPASDPEPDPVVVEAAPRRRARRATRPARRATVEFTSSVASAAVEEPVTAEPISRPAASMRAPEPEVEQTTPAAEPEAPRLQTVNERVQIDDIGHHAPEPPTFPFREVLCEIAFWQGFFNGQFYARIWGGDETSAIATSPMFRCRSATPEQTEECLDALAALHDQLIAEGWEPTGGGRAWYAVRFTNHVPV